jgi:carboxyl-terminal processing protease
MRASLFLFLLAVLPGAGRLAAAPAPPAAAPSRTPAARAEAQAFACQLLDVTGQVAEQYVRPVSRADLLLPALAGLYEGARRPVPADLAARVRRAAAAAVDPRGERPPGSALSLGDQRPLLELIARVHEDVGDAESLRGRNPLLVCCQAMARSLDPYSGVVTAQEQRRNIGLDQECDGVGLELEENLGAGPLFVRAVLPGGPAQRAGLRPGDEITRLDGKPVAGLPAAGLQPLLNRGAVASVPPLVPDAGEAAAGPSRPVRVTFRRRGRPEARTVVLRGERFRPETVLGVRRRDDNSWDYLADRPRGLAHVRLSALGKGTGEELRAVVAGLKDEGVRGLVLDLRWCPGGFLNEAVEAADLFLGEGTVATVKSRGREDNVYRSTKEGKFADFPVVVLVNGETSGGAELIAAALQDHGRAAVAGQRTLGKASVQTPLPLGVAGVGLKLTSGTFVRPSGKNLHRFPDSKPADDWGVRPDEGAEFRISADLSRALRQWWLQQTLRPGSSSERLPLDDPTADPQRQAALEVLARKLDGPARAKKD